MADQVKVTNLHDGKHRVAYDMAISLWFSEKKTEAKMSERDEFLDLVKDCIKALNTPGSRK